MARKSSSLDAKVVRLTLAIMALAGAVEVGFIGFTVHDRFAALQLLETEEALGRLSAAFEEERHSLASFTLDYAAWNDARAYVMGSKPGFPGENFNPQWADVSELDRVVILSPSTEILWSGRRIADAFSETRRDDGDLAPGSPFKALAGARAGKPWFDLEKAGNILLIECAQPVTSSDYSAPPLGWIYFARRVDERMLDRISEKSGLRTILLAADGRAPGSVPVGSGTALGFYLDAKNLRNLSLPLLGADGAAAAVLKASMERRLDRPERRLIVALVASIFGTATVMAAALLMSIRRLAVRPLGAIARRLSELTESPAPGARIGMGERTGRDDEMGILSDRIDTLLASLESERKKLETANRELERMAQIDFLTGLANRRLFEDYAMREVRRIARGLKGNDKKGSIAVLIADIDHFKLFNDCRGHLEGDACIKAVADALNAAVHRPADMACRFGGEEFLILLPETDLEGAMKVASNIRSAMHALAIPFAESPVRPFVTLSVGASAGLVGKDFSLQALIAKADEAMYAAKRAGRDSIMPARDTA